jgi:membrane-bound ClpP family serine protease
MAFGFGQTRDGDVMGANSQQGWALFLFLIGFTLLPAGLAYLGFVFALAGLACLVASAIWFIRIKPLEYAEEEGISASMPPSKRAV